MTRSSELCPRCGCAMRFELVPPALSRFDNLTFVCAGCGTDEALWQSQHPAVPLPPLDQVAAYWSVA